MLSEWSNEWVLDRVCEACPEMGDEIRSIVSHHNITFDAQRDRDDLCFTAVPGSTIIRFAVQPIGRLWARAYAYHLIYTNLSNGREIGAKPLALLTWARAEEINAYRAKSLSTTREFTEYPDGVPCPFMGSKDDIVANLAGDLTMLAVGIILLHEIAHIRLSHPGIAGPAAHAEEFGADIWATDTIWNRIVDYCTQNYEDRTMRSTW